MKRYRVEMKPCVNSVFVEVEAKDEDEAKEKAEDLCDNGDIEIDDFDLSSPDFCDVISVKEIK